MKKNITIIIFILFVVVGMLHAEGYVLPNSSQNGTSRIVGLGGAVTSLSDNLNVQTMNPAALYFTSTARLHTGLNYLDTFQLENTYNNGLGDFLHQPSITFDLTFTAPGWFIGAYSDYCLENKGAESGILTLDVTRLNVMKAGIALGIGSLSIGADVSASKKSKKNGLKIDIGSDVISIGAELLQEIFFAELDPNNDETLEVGLGMMLDVGIFTLGVYSDKVVDFMPDSGSGTSINLGVILQNLDFGISMSTDGNTGAGRFQFAHLLLAADLKNIGDDTSRTLNLGLEGSLMFTNRLSLAVQLGYNQPAPDLNSILSLTGYENGVYSIGVSSDLLFMTVNAAVVLPYQTLTSLFSNTGGIMEGAVVGVMSFGIFL
ncbi:MAG: hypothetical protein KAQ69_13240 [Spirochaetales bacterium]|nr:hypothetical protein [Spirochaetales bacterium]